VGDFRACPFQLQKFITNFKKASKNMKQLGLDANSIFLSKKIYWKIFQEVSPPQI